MNAFTQAVETARRADLLALAGQYAKIKKVSASEGGEWAGPCPICRAGTDRFRVQPARGRWLCRYCTNGVWSDVIGLKAALMGLDPKDKNQFKEVVAALCGPGVTLTDAPLVARDEVDMRGAPSAQWQERASAFASECEILLFDPKFKAALDWLKARGLTESTIRQAGLGYNPTDRHDAPALWGFAETDKPVWLPRGVTIPCSVAGTMWNLFIRRRDYDLAQARAQGKQADKLIGPRGWRPALYLADSITGKADLVFCEGQLDALLLWQECNQLADVVTLGACKYKLNVMLWGPYIAASKRRWIGYDIDEPGESGAAKLAWLGQSKRLPPPAMLPDENDWTDCYRNGANLRAYVAQMIGGE